MDGINSLGSNGNENVAIKTKPKKVLKRPIGNGQPKQRNEKGRVLPTLIAVAFTALIVGGGIYAWQSKTGESRVQNAQKQVQETKISYEQRLESIKNSLSAVENEKSELQKQTEGLLSKVGLLKKAKIDFSDPVFGLALSHPAFLGELSLIISTSSAGTKLSGVWSDTEKVLLGGTSDDYISSATSGLAAILEIQGFTKEKNDYFLLFPGKARLAVKPIQVLTIEGGEALIIDQKSFSSNDNQPPSDIGANLAAVFNLKTGPVKGAAIINTDFGVFPMDDFVKMIKSLKIN